MKKGREEFNIMADGNGWKLFRMMVVVLLPLIAIGVVNLTWQIAVMNTKLEVIEETVKEDHAEIEKLKSRLNALENQKLNHATTP